MFHNPRESILCLANNGFPTAPVQPTIRSEISEENIKQRFVSLLPSDPRKANPIFPLWLIIAIKSFGFSLNL